MGRQHGATDARYFGQVYWPAYDSGMLPIDLERGVATIPFGLLDDDADRDDYDHIHVDFKPPCYVISDSLP